MLVSHDNVTSEISLLSAPNNASTRVPGQDITYAGSRNLELGFTCGTLERLTMGVSEHGHYIVLTMTEIQVSDRTFLVAA